MNRLIHGSYTAVYAGQGEDADQEVVHDIDTDEDIKLPMGGGWGDSGLARRMHCCVMLGCQ